MKIKLNFKCLLYITLIFGIAVSCTGCQQTATSGDGMITTTTVEVVSDDSDITSSVPDETFETAESTVTVETTESLETTESEEATEPEETTESAEITESVETTEPAETTEPVETTVPEPTIDQQPPEDNIENLDKTILHFGYDQNGPRDENNAPAGMAWYIRNWGKWATFLQNTKKKEIYLTFNMGYEIGYTAGILDILKEHNIKAVFFLVGEYAETAPDLVWRMINEGHILGNHSYAHPPGGLPTLSLQDQIADTIYMHNLVKNKYGYDMKLYRFPSGAYSTQSLEAISRLGYKQVFYSFYYYDYDENNQPDPAAALKTSLEQLHPGAIYMFHTISSTNAQIFAEWVNGVLAQGYTFGIYPVE